MRSLWLVLWILVLDAACTTATTDGDDSPDKCHYVCTGHGCPELIVRDIGSLTRAIGDGADLYWMSGATLVERDTQGGTTRYPGLDAYPTAFDINGGQAWAVRAGSGEPVHQLDLESWSVTEHAVSTFSLVALPDGSAALTSDAGLLRVSTSGVSILDPSIRGGVVGRRDDGLLVAFDHEIDAIDGQGQRTRLVDVDDPVLEVEGFGDHVVFRTSFRLRVLTSPGPEAVVWDEAQLLDSVVGPSGVLWVRSTADGRRELVARRWDEVAPRVLAWDIAPRDQTPIIALVGGAAVYGAGETNLGELCALVKVPSGLP